ncbi:uncharacterized protein HKW66_Vig0103410 [Vigna angularis]|uniref:Dolichyl-diphosphooligosaccharide--protein glycosyltransferase subunit KCP2 n=1 Tax=Phaseolus angularis TaxID=3914 RepID=A0A8T0KJB7_PHAAN|nr:uncharacterized protein HKW66_Vig0103410 [Vigna angularis]
MAGSGSSMLYSFLLFTVILSLQEMYRGKLASSELFTILGGFISSLLFLVLLTETIGARTGWGAVIVAEAVALIAASTVHRVCITTCFLFSAGLLYEVNKVSGSAVSTSDIRTKKQKLLILGLDSAASSRTAAVVLPLPLSPSPVGVVNRAEKCAQHRRSQRLKSLRERSRHALPPRVAHAPTSGETHSSPLPQIGSPEPPESIPRVDLSFKFCSFFLGVTHTPSSSWRLLVAFYGMSEVKIIPLKAMDESMSKPFGSCTLSIKGKICLNTVDHVSQDIWILDSGATDHMTPFSMPFVSYAYKHGRWKKKETQRKRRRCSHKLLTPSMSSSREIAPPNDQRPFPLRVLGLNKLSATSVKVAPGRPLSVAPEREALAKIQIWRKVAPGRPSVFAPERVPLAFGRTSFNLAERPLSWTSVLLAGTSVLSAIWTSVLCLAGLASTSAWLDERPLTGTNVLSSGRASSSLDERPPLLDERPLLGRASSWTSVLLDERPPAWTNVHCPGTSVLLPGRTSLHC